MAWGPSFDGYALDATNGITMQRWSDHGASVHKFEENLADGQTIKESYLRGRAIKAELLVIGSSASDLASKLGALMKRLQQRDAADLILTTNRKISAFCSPGEIEYLKGSSGLSAQLKVEWNAEEPYWIKTSSSTGSVVNSAAAVSFVATNNGTAPALPDFEIENTGVTDYSGVTVTIENTTIGIQLRAFQMDLDAGDTLIIKANGEVYIEAPAGATSKTPKRLDGSHPHLQEGANTLQFSHAFGTGSDITFRANWSDTYHVLEAL